MHETELTQVMILSGRLIHHNPLLSLHFAEQETLHLGRFFCCASRPLLWRSGYRVNRSSRVNLEACSSCAPGGENTTLALQAAEA